MQHTLHGRIGEKGRLDLRRETKMGTLLLK